MLAGAVALATGSGEAESPAEGPDDAVVLGEEDLADRAEILRNMYRRITPPDIPLVQDVGTWPAAWEEFGANWDAAAADREFGAWVVPVEVSQEAGLTVVEDGNGAVLWRGWTDFARPESDDVVLTGGLVAEEEWPVYEGIREALARLEAAGGTPAPPVRSTHTNGLRFTAHEWTTNGTFRLELAYETDTDVDVFAYAEEYASEVVVATWTNDENQVITDTNTVWHPVGSPFNGMENDWELLGTVAISNGVAEFEDSGFPEAFGRLRFYAAAEARDTDGDGLNDGMESYVWHTDPEDEDTDGDGFDDGLEVSMGAPVNNPLWTGDELAYRLTHVSCTITTNSRSVTTNWHGLRAEVENSLDCGGSNDSQQVVTAELEVDCMLDSGYHIGLQIDGWVEDVDTNYDVVTFVADTDYYCFSSRDGIPDGQQEYCLMVAASAVLTCLALEDSTVELTYDTVGHKWHSDAYAEITYATNLGPHVTAVTGPAYVQVGKTIQMSASQEGGGPYQWTVSDPTLASIDENGVLTGVAPGVTAVRATDCAGCTATQTVTVVQIDFLSGGGSEAASELKIGKWTNAFGRTISTTTNVALTNRVLATNISLVTNYYVKENFIDLDPDRFKVRVTDVSKAGEENVFIALSTDSGEDGEDDPNGIMLFEEPDGSGIFVSTNLLLVADDIDDDFSNGYVSLDDTANDRTHKIALDGKVLVQYEPEEDTWMAREISVDKKRTVHVIPVILRDKPEANNGYPVMSVDEVLKRLGRTQKRFAQVGIDVTWETPVVYDPPAGVDLSDGLTVRTNENDHVLAPEARTLVDVYGTTNTIEDIHIFYVTSLDSGTDNPPGGMAVTSNWFSGPAEAPYLYNVFIKTSPWPEWTGCALAHELGHLFGNPYHASEKWRVMHGGIDLSGVCGSRRFVTGEESNMYGDSHVQTQQ